MISLNTRSKVLDSDDVEQGDVVWLPPYAEVLTQKPHLLPISCNRNKANRAVQPEAYGHPILILSRPATAPHKIQFLILTTFHGQKLTKRFKSRQGDRNWQKYLPLAPYAEHPLEALSSVYAMLTFEGGPPSDRRGYVNVFNVYEMEWKVAQRFWTKSATAPLRTRLDEVSMGRVLDAVANIAKWRAGEQYRPSWAYDPGDMSAVELPADSGETESDVLLPDICATTSADAPREVRGCGAWLRKWLKMMIPVYNVMRRLCGRICGIRVAFVK